MTRKWMWALTLMVWATVATAGPVTHMPTICVQPNGDTLHCWVSGDEYFHRLYDEKGYTIVQDVKTGMYVYATRQGGVLVPTEYAVGQTDPASVGLEPHLMPAPEELRRLRHAWNIPPEALPPAPKTSGRNHGTINNVVIFVRFAGESVCTTSPFATIDAMFNDSTAGISSMYNYFWNASYHKLAVRTHYYPTPTGGTVASYQDSMSRNYYMPYSGANPSGYVDDADRRSREFGLLQRAVEWVNSNCPVSSSINLDVDNDGWVDNLCFVVSGTYTGWGNLLWPHQWSLYDRSVYINGKRVYGYNFQLAGSGSHYFSTSTLCHEMGHSLGAPDLYHYDHYTNVSPAGSWDLMCSNQNPPQQTNALFKLKYMNWFDSIEELTDTGTYTLHSLSAGEGNAYKIASSEPQEWYILEYRNTADTFDASVPGRGLLIWRYNRGRNADNADFNNTDTLHELWLFRPNSTDDITAGNVAGAAFGENGRNTFSAVCGTVTTASNPYPYLCNGVADTTFSLTNIQVSNDHEVVTFTFTPHGGSACGRVTDYPETMDFEDGSTGCWEVVTLASGNNSRVGVYEAVGANAPHGGSHQFRFSSYSTASDYNQYLISPKLQPSNPLHLVFYYMRTDRASEQFAVRYSTTGNSVSDFTETLHTQTVTALGWQRCDLLVPETAKYVAIHYFSNYQYYLYVDDIELRDTLRHARLRDTVRVTVVDTMYYEVVDTVEVTVYDTHYVSPAWHHVEVTAYREYGGVGVGSGDFAEGAQLEVAGIANEGYVFDHWGDGVRTNPRSMVVDGEMWIEAHFTRGRAAKNDYGDTVYVYDTIYEHDTVWLPMAGGEAVVSYVHELYECDTTTFVELTVATSDSTMGLGVGNGLHVRGTVVEIGALARPGYRMTHWSDGEVRNPRRVTLREDTRLTAFFAPVGTLGVEEEEQQQARVWVSEGRIVVECEGETEVAVYDMMGRKVAQAYRVRQRRALPPLPRGVYMVKTDARVAKKVVVM